MKKRSKNILVLIVGLIFVNVSCTNPPTLFVYPSDHTFVLSDSTYYINNIRLDSDWGETIYEVSLNESKKGVYKIKLSSLPEEYVSSGYFDLSDTIKYGIMLHAINIENQKSFNFYSSIITSKDTLPFPVRAFILRP